MKGKIKVLSLLLALAMVVAVFAGCKKDEPAKGEEEDYKIDTSTPVELLWYAWGAEPKNPGDVQKALNEMSKADINTTVKWQYLTENEERMKKILSTGEKFDIGFSCSWFANYTIAAQGDQLLDITTDVQKKTPKLWASMPESVWEGTKVNGKIYGVPTYKDTAAQQFWLVNKEYVIDGAKAEAELKATGRKLSTVTPLLEKIKAYADAGTKYPNDLTAPFNFNKAGLNGYNTGWDQLLPSIWIGVKLAGVAEGTKPVVQSYLSDSEYIEDLKVLKDWADKGYTNADSMTTDKEPENIIVSTAQGWEGAEITAWGAGKNYTVQINAKDNAYLTTAYVTGSVNVISPKCEVVDRALLYLEYVNTDADYRNMYAYGLEGTHYKNNGDGTISFTDKRKEFEPGAFSQAAFTLLLPVAPAPADMYKKIDAANKAATASDLLGFAPNTESINTEVVACEGTIAKYTNQLLTGRNSGVDATVAKLLEEWNKNGYERIITEVQKQVDEFMANKG